jgi:signal transduction histidine kinase
MQKNVLRQTLLVLTYCFLAIVVQTIISRKFDSPFIGVLYPVAFFVSWRYGFRYTVFATIVLSLAAVYFIFSPRYQFTLLHGAQAMRILIFIVTSLIIAKYVEAGTSRNTKLSAVESRFRRSAKAINLGAWYSDLPLNDLNWDDEVKDQFWLPPDAKVTIDTFYERIHPDDRQRTKEAIETSISEKAPYDIIYRTTNPENPEEVKYIRAIGWTDYDADGKPIHFDGITLDNTHMRRVSQDLKESLEVVETINRVGTSLSGELDQKKLVQQVTDAATQLSKAEFGAFFYNLIDEKGESLTLYTISGVPIENFTKFPMPRNTQIFAPTFRGEGIIRSDDITKDPRYGHNEPYFGMPKGHLPVVSYLAVPVVSRTGEVIGGLFLGHKNKGVFTEREEKIVAGLAAQIAIAMDNASLFQKVNESVRIRDEFLSISSHELRTPLTSLKMQIQLFEHMLKNDDKIEREKIQKMLEVSHRQVNRLNTLVEDLLDVSRISNGKLSLSITDVNLSNLVKEVVERYMPLITQAKCSLDLSVIPGLVIKADHVRIEQIVINLLTNAMKYAPGSHIAVSLSELGGQARLSVKDNGPGISPEDQPKIFNRFERVNSRKGQVGLGLGLYIVQQIAEAHQGSVKLVSAKDQGAEFIITLPVDKVQS